MNPKKIITLLVYIALLVFSLWYAKIVITDWFSHYGETGSLSMFREIRLAAALFLPVVAVGSLWGLLKKHKGD